jgi:hypothetical protein
MAMGLFGTKKGEDKPGDSAPTLGAGGLALVNSGAGKEPIRVGIDHAILLIRSLPAAQDIDLVVTVLKKTLESLNIRVADIVSDASQRQQEIETRVGALKEEIKTLEGEIEKRVDEIRRLESAHEETTRVKDYFLRGEPEDAPKPPAVI